MTNDNKYRVLTISDHPLVPSGVGLQTNYLLQGLLKTGKYQFRSLGAALKHADYRPIKIQEYGDDWIIHPIDGYGNEFVLKQIFDSEKYDALLFVTDPRFYDHVFNMSDEIRDRGIALLYWHVWDNFITPRYNRHKYDSCDFIGCISKLTKQIMHELDLDHKSEYIPHSVDSNIFKPFSKEEILKQRETILGPNKDKFIVFYNSRNARRKMTSDVVKTFSYFLKVVGNDKAFLLMQTDPFDQEGANLLEVANVLGLNPTQIAFSNNRVGFDQLAMFYNVADVTINISNAEGFGLSCLESLYCGTPVIVNKTGGLQDQVLDDQGNEYGVCIEPATRSLVGSQQIPYIFEDRNSDEDVLNAFLKMYKMSWDERKALGKRGSERCLRDFSMSSMVNKWDNALEKYINIYRQNTGNPYRIKYIRV